MRTFREVKFSFTEEEIKMVRDFWRFLLDMDDTDYDDLFIEIGSDDEPFFSTLDELLKFMEML